MTNWGFLDLALQRSGFEFWLCQSLGTLQKLFKHHFSFSGNEHDANTATSPCRGED